MFSAITHTPASGRSAQERRRRCHRDLGATRSALNFPLRIDPGEQEPPGHPRRPTTTLGFLLISWRASQSEWRSVPQVRQVCAKAIGVCAIAMGQLRANLDDPPKERHASYRLPLTLPPFPICRHALAPIPIAMELGAHALWRKDAKAWTPPRRPMASQDTTGLMADRIAFSFNDGRACREGVSHTREELNTCTEKLERLNITNHFRRTLLAGDVGKLQRLHGFDSWERGSCRRAEPRSPSWIRRMATRTLEAGGDRKDF